jgi:hypothetical protein
MIQERIDKDEGEVFHCVDYEFFSPYVVVLLILNLDLIFASRRKIPSFLSGHQK